MAAGAEHSAPLKVKYHRAQQVSQLWIRRAPVQETRSAVLSDSFLKVHSCENINRNIIDHLKISNLSNKIETVGLKCLKMYKEILFEGSHGLVPDLL